MSQDNLATIQGLYEAFGRGDVPAVVAGLDEAIEWHAPSVLPQGGDFRGPGEVGNFFEGVGRHWEGLDVQIEAFVTDGDRVVALGQARGRVDGNESGYRFAQVWTVQNEKPVRFDEYVDPDRSLVTRSAGKSE